MFVLVDERDLDHHRRASRAEHVGARFDHRTGSRRAHEVQGEIRGRDPAGRGRARREAAADDVDQRGERAGPRVPQIGAQLGHDRHPRPAPPALVVVFEREAQVAQEMVVGRVDDGHGTRDGTERARVSAVRDRHGAGLSDHERRDRALRIDAAELVALVRVAVAVERPRVPGAHELVAGDVTLREIVVEVGAPAGRAAEPTVMTAPEHVVVAVDSDRADLARFDGRGRNLH